MTKLFTHDTLTVEIISASERKLTTLSNGIQTGRQQIEATVARPDGTSATYLGFSHWAPASGAWAVHARHFSRKVRSTRSYRPFAWRQISNAGMQTIEDMRAIKLALDVRATFVCDTR